VLPRFLGYAAGVRVLHRPWKIWSGYQRRHLCEVLFPKNKTREKMTHALPLPLPTLAIGTRGARVRHGPSPLDSLNPITAQPNL